MFEFRGHFGLRPCGPMIPGVLMLLMKLGREKFLAMTVSNCIRSSILQCQLFGFGIKKFLSIVNLESMRSLGKLKKIQCEALSEENFAVEAKLQYELSLWLSRNEIM